jgi:hypothetical protein
MGETGEDKHGMVIWWERSGYIEKRANNFGTVCTCGKRANNFSTVWTRDRKEQIMLAQSVPVNENSK